MSVTAPLSFSITIFAPLSFSFSVSAPLSFSISAPLSLSLSLSQPLSLSLYVCLSLFLYLSAHLSFSISAPLSFSISLPLSFPISAPLSFTIPTPLSLSLPLSLALSLPFSTLTLISIVGSSILTNWKSISNFWDVWCTFFHFYFYRNSCKKQCRHSATSNLVLQWLPRSHLWDISQKWVKSSISTKEGSNLVRPHFRCRFWCHRDCCRFINGCKNKLGRVKQICVFEHSVMINFNCACPAIQRGQRSGFLSEGSSWLTACMSEQRRFWRDCADAQARLNLRCSHRL